MNSNIFKVEDRASFVKFLHLFREELKSHPEKWENKTLDDFLATMATYTEEIDGYYEYLKGKTGENVEANIPSWRVFADIMRGARVYE